jgi:hypothetical protein
MFRFMQSLDLKYVVTETAIVAIAVAMALSADTWWEDRTDRATESAYLQGLQEEFSATSLDLEQEITSSMISTAAIDELLAIMASNRVEASSNVAGLLASAFDTSVLRAITATYDDLVASGSTGLLTSNALRIALANWSAQLEIHRRLEDHILFPHYLATDDFMMRNPAVSEVFQTDQIPKAPFEAELSGLLANRDLWNLLVARRTWIRIRRMSLDELQRTLKRVQTQLAVAE